MTATARVSGERVRGLGLTTLVTRGNGVPMEEAIIKANELGLVIVSNSKLNNAREDGKWPDGEKARANDNDSSDWRMNRDVFCCWSGTMVGYVQPGMRLEKYIEYTDNDIKYVFPVPQEYQGEKNVALVVDHPYFEIEKDRETRVIKAIGVGIVTEFPAADGWYHGDFIYGIPHGHVVEFTFEDARYFRRIEKRVGLSARADWYGYKDRHVFLNHDPLTKLGVLVEKALEVPKA